MSSDGPAIAVRGLGKSYRLEPGPTRRWRARGARERPTHWALRDVSFDVEPGRVLGLIGRNGAGKSTLLKILSRITVPTEGEVSIRGRVASLLEVGTGFHHELTGRENVFLNGTILGMRRREVARRFDAIVDFAGIGPFLDTPVKHYSSGMYMRLAFAVAAHVEPDVLIVDEVLAVGDAEFQAKCLGKIGQIAGRQGRTVILVSHTMAAIEALCDRAIYLDRGRVAREGPAREIVAHYLASTGPESAEGTPLVERTDRTGSGKARLVSFHIEDDAGRPVAHVASGRDVDFVLGYEATGSDDPADLDIDVGISVHSRYDTTLFVLYSSYTGQVLRPGSRRGEFRCTIPRLPLSPGQYRVGARLVVGGEEADWPRDGVGGFRVEAGDFYRTGRAGCDGATAFLVDGRWSVR
ncbi:MAG TPA: ABC transporter ATP-binding protein [Isosphaeraceae bacterium]|jgi:lipopolysaccharide transport system ATP-binding protein